MYRGSVVVRLSFFLLTIVLSIVRRFTASDHPFGILIIFLSIL